MVHVLQQEIDDMLVSIVHRVCNASTFMISNGIDQRKIEYEV